MSPISYSPISEININNSEQFLPPLFSQPIYEDVQLNANRKYADIYYAESL